MALFYLMWLCIAVKAAPVHQLKGEALDLAEQNGFLSDEYDRLHITELLEDLRNSLHKLDLERIHRRNQTKEKTKLNVPINEINYSLSLVHPRPVLHKNAEIITADGSESESRHPHVRLFCHLVGSIDGHNGSVSLSYCDRLRGTILTGDVEYILEPLKDGRHLVAERKTSKNAPHNYLEFLNDDEMFFNSGPENELEIAEREVRNINPVVIEIAIFCDEDMTALLEKAKADTIEKKVDYIISKFNGVQYEYDKVEQLQKRVILQIKKMVFFKTNPDWLHVTNRLGSILGPLCRNTLQLLPYDIIFMITGHSPIYPVGLTYVGGACHKNFRCGVSMGTSWGRYIAIAHEIGHLLGMKHDFQTECKTLPITKLGLMGGKGTDFSRCSVNDFHNFLKRSSANCLFTQNIPDDNIMRELKHKQLGHLPSVWNVTHHQYCENLMGPGYRYREKEGQKYSCDRGYYCIQLKEGPDFGLIYQEKAQGIVGMYCAPGKVCLKKQCLTYKLMTLHTNFFVRAGGWGKWSKWTHCSHSCGIGMTYRHRECNNPSPIQHKYCDGNEYEAKLCNTKPCSYESNDIIKSRADEVCQRLVQGNFLNPNVYDMTGQVYGIKGYNNVCDVHCNNSKDRMSRDAIMPDGTPCSSPDPKSRGYNDENVHMHCFRGKCQIFGCNGEFPVKTFGSSPECQSKATE